MKRETSGRSRALRRTVGLAVVAAALLAPSAASAAAFTVNSTADTAEPTPNDGICDVDGVLGAPLDCTLRAGIQTSHGTMNTGPDTITFGLAPGSTITLTAVLPTIMEAGGALDIQGPVAGQLTVSGGNARPYVFYNTASQTTISGLTVTGGNQSVVGATAAVGSGIVNESTGTLTLTEVTVRNNVATSSNPDAAFTSLTFGGGIYNNGELNLIRSTVRNNTASATAFGDIGGDTASTSASGGGIFNDSGATLNLERSTVNDNLAFASATGVAGTTKNATVRGGGIRNNGTGIVVLRRSTVSGNRGEAFGANSAVGDGGGISHAATSLDVASSTITANRLEGGGGGTVVLSGANINHTAGAVYKNTIVSAPVGASNCNAASNPSLGHNLEGGTNTCGFTDLTDQNTVAATGLDPVLADNGGPTFTHALLLGSPAIDSGIQGFLTESLDQRGLPRPFDFPAVPNLLMSDGNDIGAFERQPDPPPVITPPPAATPSGTGLRAAALKKCKKKKSKKARKKCKKRAQKLPI